jgi:hypothetical protein
MEIYKIKKIILTINLIINKTMVILYSEITLKSDSQLLNSL